METQNMDRVPGIEAAESSILDIQIENSSGRPILRLAYSQPNRTHDHSVCLVCFGFCEILRQLQNDSTLVAHLKNGSRFQHAESLDQLRNMAARGCPLCKLFLAVLEAGQNGILWFQEYHQPLPTEGAILLHRDPLDSLDDPTRMEISVGEHRSAIQQSLQFVPLAKDVASVVDISTTWARGKESAWPPSSTAANLAETWPTNDDYIGSPSAAIMAQMWLADCIRDHELCRGFADPEWHLPTRLLDIRRRDGKTEHVCLYVSHGERVTYAALSHRWGSSRPLRLTQRSLEEMQTSIPLSSMSKTFRDAISIARSFGLGFIWIDSLCIIQDSAIDWEVESAKMSQVYRNAQITIASTQGESEKGIWLPRRNFAGRPVNMQVEVPKELFGDAGTLHCRIKRETDGDGNKYLERFFNRGALDERAWVLQERVLSTRILSFTASELHWECLQKECTESKPEGLRPTRVPHVSPQSTSHLDGPELEFYNFYNKLKKIINMSQRRTDYVQTFKKGIGGSVDVAPGSAEAEELHFAWYLLVENYSRRKLTYETDKFIALSGMVQSLSCATGDTFVLGLWKPYLWRDLLWEATTHSHWYIEQGETGRRAATFQAPSWTWASVISYIDYTVNEFDAFEDHTLLAENVEVEYDVETSQFLDHVMSGTLIVRSTGRYACVADDALQDSISQEIVGQFSPDVQSEVEGQILCLAISQWSHVHGGIGVAKPSIWCLGLRPVVNQEGFFKRVGLAKWRSDLWEVSDNTIEEFRIM